MNFKTNLCVAFMQQHVAKPLPFSAIGAVWRKRLSGECIPCEKCFPVGVKVLVDFVNGTRDTVDMEFVQNVDDMDIAKGDRVCEVPNSILSIDANDVLRVHKQIAESN